METSSTYIPPDQKQLQDLLQLIEQTFRFNRDPHFYSNKLNTSLYMLNNLTKAYKNKTVYKLLQERIHQEAKWLLQYTTLSSKQISLELGVYDPPYFCKYFKKTEGVCPADFRVQCGDVRVFRMLNNEFEKNVNYEAFMALRK